MQARPPLFRDFHIEPDALRLPSVCHLAPQEPRSRPKRDVRAPRAIDADVGIDSWSLHCALAASMVDTTLGDAPSLPEAPTLTPTLPQLKGGLLQYVLEHQQEVAAAGICKVVLPTGYVAPSANPVAANSKLKLPTRRQALHHFLQGRIFPDGDKYTYAEYAELAGRRRAQALQRCPAGADEDAFLENEYWRVVEGQSEEHVVDYANDLDTASFGSGFQPKRAGFTANAISRDELNFLSSIDVVLAGINRSWLYFGSLFSTFCWHQEDDLTASFNYMHPGSTRNKLWYGIPAEDSGRFERAVRQALPLLFKNDPGALRGLNLMFPPRLLLSHGIRAVRLTQRPGECVVTLPAAYHSGFSLGLNMTEAINFATFDWLPAGASQVGKGHSQSLLPFDRVLWNAVCSAQRASALLRPAQRDALARMVADQLQRRASLRRHGAVDRLLSASPGPVRPPSSTASPSAAVALPAAALTTAVASPSAAAAARAAASRAAAASPAAAVPNAMDSAAGDRDANDPPECSMCRAVLGFAYVMCSSCRQLACLLHGLAPCKCVGAQRQLCCQVGDDTLRTAGDQSTNGALAALMQQGAASLDWEGVTPPGITPNFVEDVQTQTQRHFVEDVQTQTRRPPQQRPPQRCSPLGKFKWPAPESTQKAPQEAAHGAAAQRAAQGSARELAMTPKLEAAAAAHCATAAAALAAAGAGARQHAAAPPIGAAAGALVTPAGTLGGTAALTARKRQKAAPAAPRPDGECIICEKPAHGGRLPSKTCVSCDRAYHVACLRSKEDEGGVALAAELWLCSECAVRQM